MTIPDDFEFEGSSVQEQDSLEQQRRRIIAWEAHLAGYKEHAAICGAFRRNMSNLSESSKRIIKSCEDLILERSIEERKHYQEDIAVLLLRERQKTMWMTLDAVLMNSRQANKKSSRSKARHGPS